VGDIMDHRVAVPEHLGLDKILKNLRAPFGVYAVPGNHDYFDNIDSAIRFMRQSGIQVLRDSVVTINEQVMLVGRDDSTNPTRKSLKELMHDADLEIPVMVLDHQPRNLSEVADNNVDICISGHTHNGQVIPIRWIINKMYTIPYGYRKIGNTHFYVTSGLGLWGARIRIGTQSEIVHIVLSSEM
jgi:hypothetical protein